MEIYSYFKNLYTNCEDDVICIDSKLNIVFATDNVYGIFDTDRKSFCHLSYVLPMRNCHTMQDIVKSFKRSSFVATNVIDGKLYKFTVIPYPIEDKEYFLISLTDVTHKRNKDVDRFTDLMLKTVDKDLTQITSSIITAAENLDQKGYAQVINCVRKIRKLFDSFRAIVCDTDTSDAVRAIDLNRYFPFFINKLFEFMEQDKADIRFVSSAKSAYVRITQQNLDIICCNIIADMLKISLNRKATVTIAVDRKADSCFILFSDSNQPSGCSKNEGTELSHTLIEKLIGASDGNIFFSSGPNTTNTVAINFPHYESTDVLYAPEDFDTDGIFSVFSVMLSDI